MLLFSFLLDVEAKTIVDKSSTAVIVVDVQGDFTELKKGSLAVKGTGEVYVKTVIEATKRLYDKGYFVVASQDYHPIGHVSFASTHNKKPFEQITINDRPQMMWPNHCVQGSEGSIVLVPTQYISYVQLKGLKQGADSYSAFIDDDRQHTGLDTVLKQKGINTVVVYGLATDYCVHATATDAKKLGYTVYVVQNLSKGVAAETTAKALSDFKQSGVNIVKSLDELEF